ncbi:gamma-aminobutyric acid type B receptor subunit 2-like isoform X3 [Convolutriloba macropyga]|uniref:gamma-aminobutyric acid type B receptor subunit 2-like isoform X3 n=1 Tax=Convolutriloba macropyga TaxID=536237 RepID=UPI003F527332
MKFIKLDTPFCLFRKIVYSAILINCLLCLFNLGECKQSSKNVKILSLIPYLNCDLNLLGHDTNYLHSVSANGSDFAQNRVGFLRNYVHPLSLCELSGAALAGLNDGASTLTKGSTDDRYAFRGDDQEDADNVEISVDLIHRETKCRVDEGTRQLFQFFSQYKQTNNNNNKNNDNNNGLYIVGPLCPGVTRQVAAVLNYLSNQLPNHTQQVLYGVSVPEFSDSELYPKVRRVVPGFTQLAEGLALLLQLFHWERVAIICQQPDPHNVYSEVQHSLKKILDVTSEKATTSSQHQFERLPYKPHQDPTTILNTIKDKNLRIVIGLFDMKFLSTFMCKAKDLDLLSSRHQWIFGAFNLNSTLQMDSTYCEQEMSQRYYQSHSIPSGQSQVNKKRSTQVNSGQQQLPKSSSLSSSSSQPPTTLEMESTEGKHSDEKHVVQPESTGSSGGKSKMTSLSKLLEGSFLVNIHNDREMRPSYPVPTMSQSKLLYQYAYDSIHYISHRERYQKIEQIQSSNDQKMSNASNMTDSERNDRYGYFGFGNGDRISTNDRAGELDIFQFTQGSQLNLIGVYSTYNNLYTNISEPFWKGGTGNPPNDSPRVIHKVTHVTAVFYLALSVVASLGMLLSLGFLVFNVRNRHIRFIKMSSPNLNNVIIGGCLLSYASVFFLGFDSNMAQNVLHLNNYHAVCSIRAWFLTSAFTLSYGSMFSKTWRVHQIFTNVKMKKKVIKDYQLFVVIVFFLFVDILLLISWELLDPMKIKRTQFATVSISADEEQVLFSDRCHCTHMAKWLALLYGYKGLTMLFGCFLAWETRSVTIPALNDSKYIGINVYVVMLVCLVSIGVSSVIDDADHSFILLSTLILFATTITLCLVFVPKFRYQTRSSKHLVQFKKVDMNQRQRFSVASTAKKKLTPSSARNTPPNTNKKHHHHSSNQHLTNPNKQSKQQYNHVSAKILNNPVPCNSVVSKLPAKVVTNLNVDKISLATRKSNSSSATLNYPSVNATIYGANLPPGATGGGGGSPGSPGSEWDAMSLQVPSSSSQENSHQQQQQMQQYEQLQLQQKSMLDALRAKLESNRELFEQKQSDIAAVREKIETFFGTEAVNSVAKPHSLTITTYTTLKPSASDSDNISAANEINLPPDHGENCGGTVTVVKPKTNVTTKLSFLNDVEVIWDKRSALMSEDNF